MDEVKKAELIESLSSQDPPQIVPITRFFDGNDDLGSIGCNLIEHPGIDQFRETLVGLLNRADVDAVFTQIAELDPGEGCWPFANTVLVVGTIPAEELKHVLSPLQPDEVGTGKEFGAPPDFLKKQQAPVLAAWWD